MKCPLFFRPSVATKEGSKWYVADCLKEECAWWDPAHECCAVIALNETFVAVGNVIGALVDKMPHAGQFLK